MTIPEAFSLAVQHHQSGRLAEAEAIYRQILSAEPRHADALHLLGVIASQTGHHETAAGLIRRALEVRPDMAAAHVNLGNALKCLDRGEEAGAAYRSAIHLQPDFPEAHNNLGATLKDQGMLDEAIAAYRHAIHYRPEYAEAHSNLGAALTETQRLDEAIASCRRALELLPVLGEAHYNLGNALRDQGLLDEAVASYRRAIDLDPHLALAWNNLGNLLLGRRQPDEATAVLRGGLAVNAGAVELHNSLGNALASLGLPDEAIASYRMAATLAPASPAIHSSYLASLHYSLRTTPAELLAEHADFERRHGAPLRSSWRDHGNTPDPGRRLKVGYVSPDFRHNVVGHFLMPLLAAHDHQQCEVHCYSSVVHPDAITERFRKAADVWRDVLKLNDEALGERICEDRIDILVDLSQHMPGNRLPVFARKPAPVQVAWLGHPWSTGLRAIDYRLTDAHMEPEGSAWSESVEKPVRLPDSWFCFDPLDEYPEPGELPALRAGHITFGCLNNFVRVNEAVLQRWTGVLRAVEGSRLLLRCPAGAARARVLRFFEMEGIDAARVEFATWTATRAKYPRLFQRMDVALDPFPYNGGTTTCDTLWMGVPVLTLPGEMVVSRIGLSILSACGMPEFVAHSETDYVQLAASLAGDLPRLAQLRGTLRERMRVSPFMDAPRFARNVEAAYRQIWRAWCAKQGSNTAP